MPYFDEYRGFIGYESLNEVVAYRLGYVLGFNVSNQRLVDVLVNINGDYYNTFASVSESYKKANDERISAGDFYKLNKETGETQIQTFKRLGLYSIVEESVVFDYLIVGRDRHDANIELLVNNGIVRPAPLFDNGISFLSPILGGVSEEKFKKSVMGFKELGDYQGNNFFGSRSLLENLKLVRHKFCNNKLRREDRDFIFGGLGGSVPGYYLDKIWSIIAYRYSYLRKVGILN